MPPRRRLILASASPRRADLLTAAGFAFDRRPVDVDERPLPNEPPGHYVRRVASEKSRRALETLDRWSRSGSIVLGADTAVVLDGAILGKPAGEHEAREMLRWLSGRRHEVLTGLSVRFNGEDQTSVTESAVFFAPLGDAEIGWLVQSGEGLDKAGSYAVQGRASRFITRIEGSYSNVVGLPVAEFWTVLRRLGVGVADLAPGV